MKEHPILFSGPMVRAILDGRKTQTRRVIKTAGLDCLGACGNSATGDVMLAGRDWAGNLATVKPKWLVGDRLWVRETWANTATEDRRHPISYRADWSVDDDMNRGFRWKPAIHMPRAASRLTLEIKSVRVERVQEINEDDAKAEGAFLNRCDCSAMQARPRTPIEAMFRQTACHIHGEEFKHLWDGINAKRGFGWSVNPWVFVIEFEKVGQEARG